MLDGAAVSQLRTFGFVVLRGAFDPEPLGEELDRTLRDGLRHASDAITGDVGVAFRYVPMMCERTPVSLSLLEELAPSAAMALGVPALPVRAKGVRYFGSADWHRDSDQQVRSFGFVGYLESLDASNGALRVLPGSHRPEFGDAVATLLDEQASTTSGGAPGSSVPALPGYALRTDPGDVIVFDKHLYHASAGGGVRHQWRVDYVEDPVDAEGERRVRKYLGGLFSPDWDGGYDVDRYPTYGAHWRATGRSWVERLGQLGVYDAAGAEEAAARARHATS
jgi:hypothetical protein